MKVLLPLLLLMSTSWSQVIAKTDTGEGRNGPDQEGISIPLSFDRLLEAKDMKKYAKICYDQELESIIGQFLKRKVKSSLTSPRVIHLSYNDNQVIRFIDLVFGNDYPKGNFNLFARWNLHAPNDKEVVYSINQAEYQTIRNFNNNPFVDSGNAEFVGGIELELKTKFINDMEVKPFGYTQREVAVSMELRNGPIYRVNSSARDEERVLTALKMNSERFQRCLSDLAY